MFVTLSVLAAGFAAPAVPLKASELGATASTAGCAAPPAAAPYADSGPSLYTVPVDHVVGRSVSVDDELDLRAPAAVQGVAEAHRPRLAGRAEHRDPVRRRRR